MSREPSRAIEGERPGDRYDITGSSAVTPPLALGGTCGSPLDHGGIGGDCPWCSPRGRQRQMAAVANKILAPGSVEFSAIRLSWFQPTEIANFVLRDAREID